MGMESERTSQFRALGDRTRLSIFEFLCAKCCPVAVSETGEVRRFEGATVGEVCCHVTGSEKFNSTISHHLRELRLAGLISAEREGKFMVCSINREAVDALSAYFANLPMPNPSDCASPSPVGATK
jgi:ArsR family transcriptional regulator